MLLKLNRRCAITLMILVASASLILLTAEACVRQGKDSSQSSAANASQAQNTRLDTGEQTITWEEQGMKFKLPAGWGKGDLKSAVETFRLRGPGGARLSVDVLDNQEGVDVEEGFRKEYEFQLKRQQSGEADDVRYLELDGVKGLLLRWTEVEAGERSINLRWQAWRRYKGKLQFVSILLWGSVNGPTDRQQELSGILNSIKLTQN